MDFRVDEIARVSWPGGAGSAYYDNVATAPRDDVAERVLERLGELVDDMGRAEVERALAQDGGVRLG